MIPFLTFLFLAGAASPSRALTPREAVPPDVRPAAAAMHWFLRPTRSGMRVILPIIDADPNTGFSFGVMPVWVVEDSSAAVAQIHSLALAYNGYLGVSGEYQYFYFPRPDESLLLRLGLSQRFDREAVAEYDAGRWLGRPEDVDGHVEFSKDSTKRFFGVGPNSPQSGESNYTLDTINYRLGVSRPLWEGSRVRAAAANALRANDIGNGGIESVRDFEAVYPDIARDVTSRQRDFNGRGSLVYDTRDSAMTTSRGSYAAAFLEGASKEFVGEYSYRRYGMEAKTFHPFLAGDGPEPATITALRLRFEDVRGAVPFWLLSQMGGKYSHRGYGEGRFVDHSVFLFGAEQRIRLWAQKVEGVTASFWLDPFVDLGTVSPRPELLQMKYMRPAAGVALRAVGRPRVVGSADFAVGQEGLKVFLDINYTF